MKLDNWPIVGFHDQPATRGAYIFYQSRVGGVHWIHPKHYPHATPTQFNCPAALAVDDPDYRANCWFCLNGESLRFAAMLGRANPEAYREFKVAPRWFTIVIDLSNNTPYVWALSAYTRQRIGEMAMSYGNPNNTGFPLWVIRDRTGFMTTYQFMNVAKPEYAEWRYGQMQGVTPELEFLTNYEMRKFVYPYELAPGEPL